MANIKVLSHIYTVIEQSNDLEFRNGWQLEQTENLTEIIIEDYKQISQIFRKETMFFESYE